MSENIRKIASLTELLKTDGVYFEKGLTDAEILQITTKFNIYFPPDLKMFLQTALPVSDGFVNWRAGLNSDDEAKNIRSRIDWPLEGLLFDVKENDFWTEEWGAKPENLDQRIETAEKFYKNYTQLIPIYSHRYIPSSPNENDNPIFSVYQTDVIYYGFSLPDYFTKEFNITNDLEMLMEPKRKIEFWSSLAEN